MSDVAHLRRLALVCKPDVALALQQEGGLRLGLSHQHFRDPGFSDQAIVWLGPDDLKRPEKPGGGMRDFTDRMEDWGYLAHLLSRRMVIYIVFVRSVTDLKEFGDRRTAYRNEIRPELQSPVSEDRLDVLVAVFAEHPGTKEIHDQLATLSESCAVYVMGHQLRVKQSTAELIHARHVWAGAVSGLIFRLASVQKQERGLFAWRAARLDHIRLRDHAQKANLNHLSLFVDWFLSAEKPEDINIQDWPKRSAGAFSESDTWKQLHDRITGVKLELPTESVEWHARLRDFADLGISPSSSSEIATNDQMMDVAERYVAQQAGASVQGVVYEKAADAPEGEAVEVVTKITNPEIMAALAKTSGEKWRKSIIAHPMKVYKKTQECSSWLGRFYAENPPRNGPGVFRQMKVMATEFIQTHPIQKMYAEQARHMGDILDRDKEFTQRREELRIKARELQRARDHLVGNTARIVLGLLSALMAGFIIVQGVDAWSGFWSGGKAFNTIPVRQLYVTAAFLGSGIFGVVIGIIMPGYLEKKAGRRAAAKLSEDASELQSSMIALLEERARFCQIATKLGMCADYAAAISQARVIAERGAGIVDFAVEAGRQKYFAPPVLARRSDSRGAAVQDVQGSWDRELYRKFALREIQGDIIPINQLDSEKIWSRIYKIWEQTYAGSKHSAKGWVELDASIGAVERLLESYLEELTMSYRKSFEDVGLTDSDSENIDAIWKDWYPGGRMDEHLPLLSLDVRRELAISSRVVESSVLAVNRSVASAFEKYARPATGQQVRISMPDAFRQLMPPHVVAFIFDEIRLTMESGEFKVYSPLNR